MVPIQWVEFEDTFLRWHLFPRELWEAKVGEFLNLEQGSINAKKYNTKFTQLSYYVVDMMRNHMSLFISGLSRLLNKYGKAMMLIKDMDIAQLVIHL